MGKFIIVSSPILVLLIFSKQSKLTFILYTFVKLFRWESEDLRENTLPMLVTWSGKKHTRFNHTLTCFLNKYTYDT